MKNARLEKIETPRIVKNSNIKIAEALIEDGNKALVDVINSKGKMGKMKLIKVLIKRILFIKGQWLLPPV